MPDLDRARAYVAPGAAYANIVEFMADLNCAEAWSMNEADFVVFPGGPDVNPERYGEVDHPTTSWDADREASFDYLFASALARGIPMFGICGGAQYLAVKNGAKMWQNVTNHAIARTHDILVMGDHLVPVTSTHHQMIRASEGMEILGVAYPSRSDIYENMENGILTRRYDKSTVEVEAFWFPETRCLGIQGHPEWGPPEFAAWAAWELSEALLSVEEDEGE